MEQSEQLNELAAALVTFQAKVGTITKDADNPFFKSKYASLENIISTIRPELTAAGLSVAQFPSGEDELTTILMHQSGQFLRSTVKISPKDRSPQGIGSAITYMRRYALSAVLGLATDEDDDGNQATQPQRKAPAAKTAVAPRKQVPSDPFEAALAGIKAARSVATLISISEKADASAKLTPEQKQEIKKQAALRVDAFEGASAAA